jgi:two-component system LytT family sensor kinase
MGKRYAGAAGKLQVDWKRFRLFVWIGVAYLTVWLISDTINYPEEMRPRLWNNIWRAIYIVVADFVFFEYVWPALGLSVRKLPRTIALLGAQFLIFSFGLYFWRFLGIQVGVYTELTAHPNLLDGVCFHFPYSVASVFFFGLILHVHDHIALKHDAQQLRLEKQQAELNYLKSQTNPHFLFNTLNNLYALSRDKSDLAPESILRLSQILRFMLYETSGKYIAVEKEIKIIEDYIALEKLRYDDSLRVEFRCEIDDRRQPVPPLLLIPLVENAFKHGVSETRHQPFVDILLRVDGRRLLLLVRNSTEKAPDEHGVRENIGLSNLRRHLELLYTDYELSVEQGENTFTARLDLNLASHV